MRTTFLSLAAAALLAAAAPAQHDACARLTATGTGKPGTDLKLTLQQRAKNAAAFLALATHRGHTTIRFGDVHLRLGLAQPIVFVPIGRTNNHGTASITFKVPALRHRLTLNAQGLTATLGDHRRLHFCTSNVLTLQLGGGD